MGAAHRMCGFPKTGIFTAGVSMEGCLAGVLASVLGVLVRVPGVLERVPDRVHSTERFALFAKLR